MGTWNVEGLTDAKIVELQLHMQKLGIGILCLQETHRTESTHEVTDDGFLLILSGAAADEPSTTAGVGFLVAPVCRRYVVSFTVFPHDVVEDSGFWGKGYYLQYLRTAQRPPT